MAAALGWGFLSASSLLVGMFAALLRPWPKRAVGLVLAFVAGALISAVSFDLAEEAAQLGSQGTLALGLAAGALTYFLANRAVERHGRPRHADSSPAAPAPTTDAGPALALGAFLVVSPSSSCSASASRPVTG